MISLGDLLELAGVSSTAVGAITEERSIMTTETLVEAARDQQLQSLPGLNISLEYHILRCYEELYTADQGILIDVARFQANRVKQWLSSQKGSICADVVGGVRRGKSLVRNVDVLTEADNPAELLRSFILSSLVRECKSESREKVEVISTLGLPLTLHAVKPGRFGASRFKLTGSQAHIQLLWDKATHMGIGLSEVLAKDGVDEVEIYQRLGLPLIPPELREGMKEVDAAMKDQLPGHLSARHIQGDLHMHTSWADGLHSIPEMAEAAKTKGYRYIGICDHSPLIEEANGLNPSRLRDQSEEIQGLNQQLSDFTILHGVEVDIRANGELDLPDEALRRLDFTIASIHMPYEDDAKAATDRLIAAMEHPLVDIVAHPMGRLLKKPDLYKVDVDRLLETATKTGTALEINSGPDRLDLGSKLSRQARERGVSLVISSDAHCVEQLGWIEFGLATARRGWLEDVDILNTLPLKELGKRLKRNRSKDQHN